MPDDMNMSVESIKKMTLSLGCYISFLYQHGDQKAKLLSRANDYRAFLQDYTNMARQAQAALLEDADFLPIEEITLPPDAYMDVVDQIYLGRRIKMLHFAWPQAKTYENPSATDAFGRYIANLDGDERTRKSVDEITGRINKILGHERSAGQQRISGLVVGRVQSGKTRNYIGLMLKAAAEGWNVIIVLTSNNRALGKQTRDRIDEDFGKANVNTAIEIDFMHPDANNNAKNVGNGVNFLWGTEIKQVTHLQNILKWFEKNNDFQKDMRVLVIDDEADNASPNTGVNEELWDEDQIDENIRIISDLNPNLGEWFRQLEDTELSESQKVVLDNILTKGGIEARQKRFVDCRKENPNLADALHLNDFRDEATGAIIDIGGAINNFFNLNRGRGQNIHKKSSFVKLLRSIFEVSFEQSQINSRIRQIIGRKKGAKDYNFNFEKCAYIGYTATPYACIFNEPYGETPLFPDFIYSLEKSPEHFGLQEIFGWEGLRSDKPAEVAKTRMDIVTVLDKTDQTICDHLLTMQITEDIDGKPNVSANNAEENGDNGPTAYLRISPTTLKYRIATAAAAENNAPEQAPAAAPAGPPPVWESLKHAVAWAFCTAAARRYARHNRVDKHGLLSGKPGACWTTMILNLSPEQCVHGILKELVEKYITGRIADRENFIAECKAEWEFQTAKFSADKFKAAFDREPERPQATPYPEWNDIEGELDHFFDREFSRVIQINSTRDGKSGQDDYWDERTTISENGNEIVEPVKVAEKRRRDNDYDVLWFVCGGNTISRGLTLSGLTVSYFNRVRNSTAVDTFTQMGRWFGYRGGYELLPRIWMPAETIVEYKRAALCEEKMHEDIADAFATERSPADGEDFMTFQCWKRKLSLRAYCTRVVAAMIASSSNWISTAENNAKGALDTVRKHLSRLGRYWMPEDNSRLSPNIPVWQNVPSLAIKELLGELIAFYPDKSQAMFRGLMQEIDRSVSTQPEWDIVSGSKRTDDGSGHLLCDDIRVPLGKPDARKVDEQNHTATFSGARAPNAWFAMIDRKIVNRIDCAILEEEKDAVLQNIMEQSRNGELPSAIDTALGGDRNASLEKRLGDYIRSLQENDYEKTMDNAIHGRIRGNNRLDGYRNRSSHDYQNRVYAAAGHNRPTLQIYLIEAPKETGLTIPLVSISVLWPGRQPDEFFSIANGVPPLNPADMPRATQKEFFSAVINVLKEADFPLGKEALEKRVLDELTKMGRACPDYFFSQNIICGVQQGCYRKFPGKWAYYHNDWAKDEGEARKKLREAFAEAVRPELANYSAPVRDKNLHNKIVLNGEKFTGLVALNDLEDLLSGWPGIQIEHKGFKVTYEYIGG